MATRRPFWKWRRWKSIGFCLWPPSTCIWNLKLKFESKLDLCSGNRVVYRHTTDGQTDKVNPVYPPSNFVGRGYNNKTPHSSPRRVGYGWCLLVLSSISACLCNNGLGSSLLEQVNQYHDISIWTVIDTGHMVNVNYFNTKTPISWTRLLKQFLFTGTSIHVRILYRYHLSSDIINSAKIKNKNYWVKECTKVSHGQQTL